jgi:hypothetical protein
VGILGRGGWKKPASELVKYSGAPERAFQMVLI